nr:VCBS repeat-containing protein [Bacteroidota bacterium]
MQQSTSLAFTALTRFITISIVCIACIMSACQKKGEVTSETQTAFQSSGIQLKSLDASQTGINFANQINDEGKVNIFTWHFIYNGGGVAAGDINNDGLVDLYFSGNMVQDKLYINKGNYKFEDITA